MDESLTLLLNELLREQRATREDIARIDATLAEKRGERRVAVWVAGFVGGLVSYAAHLFTK